MLPFEEEQQRTPDSSLRLFVRRFSGAVAVRCFRWAWWMLALAMALLVLLVALAAWRYQGQVELQSDPSLAAFPIVDAPLLLVLDAPVPERLDAQARGLRERLLKLPAVADVVRTGANTDFAVPDDLDQRLALLDRLAARQPLLARLAMAMGAEEPNQAVADRLGDGEAALQAWSRELRSGDVRASGAEAALLRDLRVFLKAAARQKSADSEELGVANGLGNDDAAVLPFSWYRLLWPSSDAGVTAANGDPRVVLLLRPATQVSNAQLLAAVRAAMRDDWEMDDERATARAHGVDLVMTGPAVFEALRGEDDGALLARLGDAIGLLLITLAAGSLAWLVCRDVRLLLAAGLATAVFAVGLLSLWVVLTRSLDDWAAALLACGFAATAFAALSVSVGARVRGLVADGREPEAAIRHVYQEASGAAVMLAALLMVNFAAVWVFIDGAQWAGRIGVLSGVLSLPLALLLIPACLRLMGLRSEREVRRSRGTLRAMVLGLVMSLRTWLRVAGVLAALLGLGTAFLIQLDADPLAGPEAAGVSDAPALSVYYELFDWQPLSPWALQAVVPLSRLESVRASLENLEGTQAVRRFDDKRRRSAGAEREFKKQLRVLLALQALTVDEPAQDAPIASARERLLKRLSALDQAAGKAMAAGDQALGLAGLSQQALQQSSQELAALRAVIGDLRTRLKASQGQAADDLARRLLLGLGEFARANLQHLHQWLDVRSRASRGSKSAAGDAMSKRYWVRQDGQRRIEIYPKASLLKDDVARRGFVLAVQELLPSVHGRLVDQVNAESGASRGMVLSLGAAIVASLVVLLLLFREREFALSAVLWASVGALAFFALDWLVHLDLKPEFLWVPLIGLLQGLMIAGLLAHRSQCCPPAMNQLWASSTGQAIMVLALGVVVIGIMLAWLGEGTVGAQIVVLAAVQFVSAGGLMAVRLMPTYPAQAA